MTALCTRLGIRHPIVQAPMAGVATPALAAAVSEAGGLGSIGLAGADVGQAAAMIAATREATSQPFQINLFCHRAPRRNDAIEDLWLRRLERPFASYGARPPIRLSVPFGSFVDDEAMLAMLLELRPPVISFHFGCPPRDVIAAFHAADIQLMMSVTSPAEGQSALDAGVDILIAQGVEAGGHRGVTDPEGFDGKWETMALTEQLSRAFAAPVIAAGGIMNGTQIGEALRVGAGAAQLGTAFLLCEEAATDAAYRAAVKNAANMPTVMTRAISGRPARCFANDLTDWEEGHGRMIVPDFPLAYSATSAWIAAARQSGADDVGVHWAGTNARWARSLPAGRLVATLIDELAAFSGNENADR